MLEIKNVNLNVGNTALLSNIHLTLEQGKIYGVLGPVKQHCLSPCWD